jgi:hypothetical protein
MPRGSVRRAGSVTRGLISDGRLDERLSARGARSRRGAEGGYRFAMKDPGKCVPLRRSGRLRIHDVDRQAVADSNVPRARLAPNAVRSDGNFPGPQVDDRLLALGVESQPGPTARTRDRERLSRPGAQSLERVPLARVAVMDEEGLPLTFARGLDGDGASRRGQLEALVRSAGAAVFVFRRAGDSTLAVI